MSGARAHEGISPPALDVPTTGRRQDGVMAYLRRHPVLCLLLLTPGIPEYLSGSSPVSALVENPAQFIFQVLANLGLYGPGVLLIREAMVRWNKGWGTVLLLGAAYGILEEGVALSTLFNSNAGPVDQLGYYGHWAGVSWVWLAAMLPVHMVYSISIPIFLLGLAAPWTIGRRFLSGRRLRAVLVILVLDVASLFLLVLRGEGFWMGTPVLVGSFAAMALLVLAARRLPAGALRARAPGPVRSPLTMLLVGMTFYPSVLVLDGVSSFYGVPAVFDFFLSILLQGVYLVFVLRSLGSQSRARHAIALILGLVMPIMVIGLVSQASLPLVILPDAAMLLFLRALWMSHPPPDGAGVPLPVQLPRLQAKVYPDSRKRWLI